MNAQKAAELIEQHGVYGLCESDGCLCTGFNIHGFSVDVSCRKSGSAKPEGFWGTLIRVTSSHMDCRPQDLELVAREVVRQLSQEEGTPLTVRYCTYEQDAKNGCVYCGKERSDKRDYLCRTCKTGMNVFEQPIAESHDYSKLPTFEQVAPVSARIRNLPAGGDGE